jgi:transposase
VPSRYRAPHEYTRGPRGYDGGKRVKGRKRHLLTDTLGLICGRLVTPANVQDKLGARGLLDGRWPSLPTLERLWADGAYDSAPLTHELAAHGCTLEVTAPPLGSGGFAVAAKRGVVERTFAWLVHQRRLRVDYEQRPEVVEAFIDLTIIRLLVRRLARSPTSETVSEYPVVAMSVAALFGLVGPGAHALDRVLGIAMPMPETYVAGLLVGIVLVLGALALRDAQARRATSAARAA